VTTHYLITTQSASLGKDHGSKKKSRALMNRNNNKLIQSSTSTLLSLQWCQLQQKIAMITTLVLSMRYAGAGVHARQEMEK
jgi:hypothetical protein